MKILKVIAVFLLVLVINVAPIHDKNSNDPNPEFKITPFELPMEW